MGRREAIDMKYLKNGVLFPIILFSSVLIATIIFVVAIIKQPVATKSTANTSKIADFSVSGSGQVAHVWRIVDEQMGNVCYVTRIDRRDGIAIFCLLLK